jgi:hypothetical protein
MSRESESEQTQRTVAELLAQYGASAGDAPPRRRRRRAEDPTDTAPQAIIERINSDSGEMKVIDPQVEPPATRSGRRAKPDVDPDRTQYAAPVRPEPPQPVRAEPPKAAAPPRVEPPKAAAPPRVEPPRAAPVRPEPPRVDQPRPEPRRPEPRRPAMPPVDPAEETRQVPPIVDEYSLPSIPKPETSRANIPKPEQSSRANLPKPEQSSRANLPKPEQSSRANLPKPNPVRPPLGPPPPPPVREAMTEVIPRVPDGPGPDDTQITQAVPLPPPAPKLPAPFPDARPEEWFGDDDEEEFTEQENTAAHPGPYVDDYSDNYSVDGFDAEGPAGLADLDEAEIEELEEEDVERSPIKEWLIMIGQLAVGVLGGAALWLGFNFLWRAIPAAALVLALGVTVGLVLLVRKIRKADDLQTTLLAVLVGLIVTVSPAAMLLVKS